MTLSQKDLIFQYYKERPNQHIQTENAVDWATAQWQEMTGEKFRDPDRAIRYLHQEGKLQKIDKGIYCYDPQFVQVKDAENFTPAQREEIFKRDDYRCVVCGMGRKEGIEIAVDHIKPRQFGGKATIDNGQTLCSKHNNLKKNYSHTESCKRVFINMYRQAQKNNDTALMRFIEDVLEVYDRHDINGHIEWKK